MIFIFFTFIFTFYTYYKKNKEKITIRQERWWGRSRDSPARDQITWGSYVVTQSQLTRVDSIEEEGKSCSVAAVSAPPTFTSPFSTL